MFEKYFLHRAAYRTSRLSLCGAVADGHYGESLGSRFYLVGSRLRLP